MFPAWYQGGKTKKLCVCVCQVFECATYLNMQIYWDTVQIVTVSIWKILIYIVDIQWLDIKYEIYFMSETWFFYIFTTVKHEWKYFLKSISYEWNKFHIQSQKHWIFCSLHFSFDFFQILNTACNAWFNVTITCYFHTVIITLLTYHSVKITVCEDITFIQGLKLVFNGWKCNNNIYLISFSILYVSVNFLEHANSNKRNIMILSYQFWTLALHQCFCPSLC